VRRLFADELILSFVPNGEQRIWRNLTRMKTQLTRDRIRLQSQMECLLEEMRIKLSSVVTDLLGASGLRILRALAAGETEAKRLVALGDDRLKCTQEQLPMDHEWAVGADRHAANAQRRSSFAATELHSVFPWSSSTL